MSARMEFLDLLGRDLAVHPNSPEVLREEGHPKAVGNATGFPSGNFMGCSPTIRQKIHLQSRTPRKFTGISWFLGLFWRQHSGNLCSAPKIKFWLSLDPWELLFPNNTCGVPHFVGRKSTSTMVPNWGPTRLCPPVISWFINASIDISWHIYHYLP